MSASDDAHQELADRLNKLFPQYLSEPSRENLKALLLAGKADASYYSDQAVDDLLQGDAWNAFKFYDFETGAVRDISGAILSNSCDVDIGNATTYAKRISYAPIVRLDVFLSILQKGGVEAKKVEGLADALRRQEVTQLFYLPPSARLPECVVILSEINSQPLELFRSERTERLFRLSNYGFYTFLMKLSIHFTRMGEAVDRNATS